MTYTLCSILRYGLHASSTNSKIMEWSNAQSSRGSHTFSWQPTYELYRCFYSPLDKERCRHQTNLACLKLSAFIHSVNFAQCRLNVFIFIIKRLLLYIPPENTDTRFVYPQTNNFAFNLRKVRYLTSLRQNSKNNHARRLLIGDIDDNCQKSV